MQILDLVRNIRNLSGYSPFHTAKCGDGAFFARGYKAKHGQKAEGFLSISLIGFLRSGFNGLRMPKGPCPALVF